MLPFNKAVENKLALIIIISCTCKLITVLILNSKQQFLREKPKYSNQVINSLLELLEP